MTRIEVELEAVTALLVHREPKGEAEWRAPSLRGLMRWWYRALMGAAVEPDAVREAEERVFGTTERSSGVIVRVLPLAASNPGNYEVNPGSAKNATTKGVPPSTRAKVILQQAPFPTGDRALMHAYAALWLAVHLGSIGQRARRGAGSLRMKLTTNQADLVPPVDATDAEGYASQLAERVRRVRQLAGASRLRRLRNPSAEYPVLHPDVADVRCCTLRIADAGAALPVRGGPAQQGRLSETDVRRALMARRRNLASHRVAQPREREFGGISPRLASPTWIKVADIDTSRALLVGSVFRHDGAQGANWANAVDFLESFKPCAKVHLG